MYWRLPLFFVLPVCFVLFAPRFLDYAALFAIMGLAEAIALSIKLRVVGARKELMERIVYVSGKVALTLMLLLLCAVVMIESYDSALFFILKIATGLAFGFYAGLFHLLPHARQRKWRLSFLKKLSKTS